MLAPPGLSRPTPFLALLLFLLAPVAPVIGQASAPIDLSGIWALNVHLTDHPEQIARAIQIDTGEFMPEMRGRGAEPVGGPGDRGTGAGRSSAERQPPADRMSGEDRKLLTEVTRLVQFPPPMLTIAQDARTVTISGHASPDVLRTDGKTEKRALETGSVNRTAAWQGPQLRVAYEIGRVGTLTYTYAIVPSSRQLLIRVNIERLPGQPGPFEIKLVYDRTPNPAT